MSKIAKTLLIGTALAAVGIGAFAVTYRALTVPRVAAPQNDTDITMIQPVPNETAYGLYLGGRQAQLNGDWAVAAERFNALQERMPQSEELRQRAMVLSMGAGDFTRAVALAEMLKGTDSHDLANLILAASSLQNGDVETARSQLQAISDGGLGKNVKPVLLAWFALSSTPKAAAASRLEPVNPLAFYHSFLISDATANRDQVQNVPPALFIQSGFAGKTLERVGDIYLRNGAPDKAAVIYNHMVAANPENEALKAKFDAAKSGMVPATMTLAPKVASTVEGVQKTYSDMASLLYQEGAGDSSRLFAQLALMVDKTAVEPRVILVNINLQEGRVDEAVTELSAIITPDEETSRSITRQIAELHIQDNDPASALASLETLVRDHNDVDAQIQIGDLFRDQEDYEKALKAYDHAVDMVGGDLGKNYWHLLYARGMTLERLKRWPEAEKDLQEALRLQPDHPYVLNYLGYSWADQGVNLDRALPMVKRAVELRPDDGYITDSLGWVYYRLSQFDKAVPVLEEAVELLPYDPVINDHLGDAYWQVGRRNEARFQWQRALNSADDPVLKEQIEAKLQSGLDAAPKDETKLARPAALGDDVSDAGKVPN
jgi:tetratricopeptide (TPR) repeat protein